MKKGRKGPQKSATECAEGTIEVGNDKQRWVVKKNRWVPIHSTKLFGYAPLTAKILAKNIRKPISVYERQLLYTWPRKSSDFDVKYTFTATGDAEKGGKVIPNWLKTKTPAVKHNDLVIVRGTMKSNDLDSTLQVAPLPGELVSTNLMNTDAFVKV